jgi:hypothetical protein
MKNLAASHTHRLVVKLATMLLLQTGILHADGPSAPSTPFYKVLSDTDIVIQPPNTFPLVNALLEDSTQCISYGTQKLAYSCTDDEKSGKVLTYTRRDYLKKKADHGFSRLTFPPGSFKSGRQYRLTYWQKDPAKPDPAASSITADTRPLLTATFESRGTLPWISRAYLFRLESPVAFISGVTPAVAQPTNCPTQITATNWTHDPVRLQPDSSGNAKGGAKALEALVQYLQPGNPDDMSTILGEGVLYVCIDARKLVQNFSPDSQAAQVILNAATSNTQTGAPVHFSDALGAPALSFAPGTKLSPAPPPTGKSDASFYANVNMVAATGARFAWGLDGKIAELVMPLGPGTITWLSATANTGNNTSSIKSQTYSDSIDWTLPWSYQYFTGGERPLTVDVTVSPDYSTDIEFNRKNFLASADSLWSFKKLYQTQSYRTPPKNGALAKYPDPTLNPFGYALQFHAGFEGGGALIATTQKASSGTAKINVPTYNIVRVVPQIRGLLQWEPQKTGKLGLLTFDDTIAGRYLFATENTVEQYIIPAVGPTPASVGLLLRPVSGWKAYNTLVGSWYPPNSSNVALTATFSDGFNPPKFSRVNSVTIGVTIMY